MPESPRHVTVYTRLRERIIDGEYPAGSAFPSEAELCAEFGTSRGPVRQALAALRRDGLISVSQGRQSLVRRQRPSSPFSSFLSFSRWAVEAGLTPGQHTLELARHRPSPDTAEALGIHDDERVVDVIRERSIDGAPAMIERLSYVDDVGRLLFDFDPDSGSIFDHLSSHGIDMESGRHEIDAIAADERDAASLGVTVGSPLLRVTRVTFSSSGRPIEFADERYRTDMVSFVIDNLLAEVEPLERRFRGASR